MLEPNFLHTKGGYESPRRWKCSFLILENRYIYRKLCSYGKYGRLLLWADGHGVIVGADVLQDLSREISGDASTAKTKWFIDTLPVPKPLKKHSNHRYSDTRGFLYQNHLVKSVKLGLEDMPIEV